VRRLLHLQRLELWVSGPTSAAFPPFVPPSLKSLDLTIMPGGILESLPRAPPSILQASGAGLEEISINERGGSRPTSKLSAEGGAMLSRVLHACLSTLKVLRLRQGTDYIRHFVPGLMRCCDTLEVLQCHLAVFSALPATCPTFPRLTELHLEGYPYDECDSSASRAWGVIIDGRLPALTTLEVSDTYGLLCGKGEEEGEGARQLARALEVVAGTLKRLTLGGGQGRWCNELLSPEASYELGVAVGKLRRLRNFHLQLFDFARDYLALGRGLVASGGCNELVEIRLDGHKESSQDATLGLLAYETGLNVPSLRDLSFGGYCTEDEALMLCCGLVQAGYKHRAHLNLGRLPQLCVLKLQGVFKPWFTVVLEN
jgi:hypothetical protein